MSPGSQNRDGKGGSSIGCYLALLERVLLAHLTLMGQMKSGDGHTRWWQRLKGARLSCLTMIADVKDSRPYTCAYGDGGREGQAGKMYTDEANNAAVMNKAQVKPKWPRRTASSVSVPSFYLWSLGTNESLHLGINNCWWNFCACVTFYIGFPSWQLQLSIASLSKKQLKASVLGESGNATFDKTSVRNILSYGNTASGVSNFKYLI